jgi:single-stranded-DNA-specific exonuclease
MKDKHLRLQLKPRVSDETASLPAPLVQGVWFNRTQELPQQARLAYRLVSDRFRAEARVQLMIEALDDQS